MTERQGSAGAGEGTQSGFAVVALGGSAGGLEALQDFFDHVPDSPGAAFVVVTHLQPGRTSLLPELLAKHSVLPVIPATEGLAVEADRVYIAMPDSPLTIRNGVLGRVAEKEVGVPHPVDRFFRALAEDQGRRAVGIVLSGTGTDGTLGLRAVKEHGGMTMVQEPHSARFDGMPTSARETGLADFVLVPADMPAALQRCRQTGGADGEAVPAGHTGGPTDHDIAEITALLRARTGHDFSDYKQSTLCRRIERRMQIHQIGAAGGYIHYLHNNVQELDLLFRDVVISVTSFFRDPAAWQALDSKVLIEQLQAAHDNGREYRAWVVGCASGEEAYTLAILLTDRMGKLGIRVPLQIFATDIDERAIETARSGRYPAGIVHDVPPDLLEKYFVEEADHYRIRKSIRANVVFAVQNVLQDPPFTRLDLISCRNLLIYMRSRLQQRLLPRFHYALAADGTLFLGSSESVGGFTDLFRSEDKREKIFRRCDAASLHGMASLLDHVPAASRGERGTAPRVAREHSGNFARMIERLLANRFAPPTVVVNDQASIVYVHGRTGRYLEPATGLPDNDLLDMAREGLRASLANALRRVATSGEGTLQTSARVRVDDTFERVELDVRRIEYPEPLRGLRLVSFLPSRSHARSEAALPPDATVVAEPAAGGDKDHRIVQLEQELQAARGDNQATVEELEASNEELQSTNEELQSTNEELQSSNEELETSKEEMESLNEELQMVNAELESKVRDLAQVNDDMQNLLNSTRIATIFLDNRLRIKRFTPEASRLVALRDSDIGRPIAELQSHLHYTALVEDARRVLDTLQPLEKEIQSAAGHWYLLRMVPYRTTEQVIDGLVCTFVDTQPIKDAETRRGAFLQSIVQTVREPLVVLDAEYRVVMANDRFYTLIGLDRDQVVRESLFDVGGGQWDIDELRGLLERVLSDHESFNGFELTARFGRRGSKRLVLNARQMLRDEAEPGMILLAMEDLASDGDRGHGSPS